MESFGGQDALRCQFVGMETDLAFVRCREKLLISADRSGCWRNCAIRETVLPTSGIFSNSFRTCSSMGCGSLTVISIWRVIEISRCACVLSQADQDVCGVAQCGGARPSTFSSSSRVCPIIRIDGGLRAKCQVARFWCCGRPSLHNTPV